MSGYATKIRNISAKDFPKDSGIEDKIKFLLKYAILAPSTHNIQPWLFKINGNICELRIDKDFHLPKADKIKRDAYISLGCCLENLIIAGKYYGIYEKYEYVRNVDGGVYVKIFFRDEKTKENKDFKIFLESIKTRVNMRGIFSNKRIDDDAMVDLDNNQDYKANVNFVTDENKIEQIAKLTSDGMKLAHSDKNFRAEMCKFINNNLSNKKYGIHGFSMKMPLLFSFILPRMIKSFNMGFLLSRLNYKSISSAPAVCVFTVKKESPESWIETGRLAQNIMLKANKNSLRTSIFVAAIEMGNLREKLKKIIQTTEYPTFLFCVGYMKGKAKLTPRIPLAEKLIK